MAVQFWLAYDNGIRLSFVLSLPGSAQLIGMYKACSDDNVHVPIISRTENSFMASASFFAACSDGHSRFT